MRSGTQAAAAPDPRYCRLTVLAPQARVDVALPADVPVAELVPMVLELVGEPVFGLRPQAWRLSGVAGGPLPPDATLAQLGVPDGELLRLGPDGPLPPPPVFDDPVDALASTAGGAAPGADRRFAAASVVALATGAAALLAGGANDTAAMRAVTAGLCCAAAVAVAARLAGHGERLTSHTSALVAVPLAAAAAFAALPGLPGAVPVLVAAAAAGVTAAAAQIALRIVAPILIAVVVATLPLAIGALVVARFGSSPAAAGAAISALMLVAMPLLPRIALRLSGLPRPVVPTDGAELVMADDGPDLLPPDEFAERADLARGYLAGLVGGCATVAALAALPAAAAGGWAGPVLAAVVMVVLALRARGFADPAPVRTLLACAATGSVGLALILAARPEPQMRFIAVGVLLVSTAAALSALSRTEPTGSPVSRRAIDLLDGLLAAAAVPLAFAAMDLFRLVRGL